MKKKIILVLFQVFLLFLPVSSQVNFGLPFTKCWEVKIDNLVPNLVASDNDTLYLTSQEKIETVSEKGYILWTQSFPNENILKIFLTHDFLVVVSENNKVEDNNSSQRINVSRIGTKTGLILQKKENIVINNNNEMVLKDGKLLFIFGKELFLLNIDNFDIEQRKLPLEYSNSEIKLTSELIFSETENEIIFSLLNKKEPLEISLGKFKKPIPKIKTLIPFQDNLIFTDKFGSIGFFNQTNRKVIWKQKLGGEINQIEMFENSIYAVSNDNFIYKFSIFTGEKIWKKKLLGRSQFNLITDLENGLTKLKSIGVINIGEQSMNIIESGSGRPINQIEIEKDEYFVGKPYIINGKILLLTNFSILGYEAQQCKKAD